jgi:hypothetical protein
MYAALEVDYSESDKDSTGEAFERTKKVCLMDQHGKALTIVPHIL